MLARLRTFDHNNGLIRVTFGWMRFRVMLASASRSGRRRYTASFSVH